MGKGQLFEIYDEDTTQAKLSLIEGEERRAAPAPTSDSTSRGGPPDDDAPPSDPIPAVAMETE